MAEARTADRDEEVRGAARQLDRDRYLAALLAPAGARQGLLTIAAFHGEIARIPVTATEPTIGAIRLQWWRDVLDDAGHAGDVAAPVADAMLAATRRGDVNARDAVAIVDAYETLLHPGALAAPEALAAFADASQGAAFRMAAHVLGGSQASYGAVISDAAQAYGRAQLLRLLPALLAKGHNPLAAEAPSDWRPILMPIIGEANAALAAVRRQSSVAPATIRQAILPTALVEPYLAALERLGSRIAFEQAEISPLSRIWRIYLASRRERF